MADSMGVNSINPQKIDLNKWKKLTAQEILKEESKGENIPAELIAWAQQMAAFSKIPDDVTYEQVDGDIGIDALNKLGIEENPVGAEDENAIAAEETEEPDAVKDPAQTEETSQEDEENIFMNPVPGQAADEIPPQKETEEPIEEDLTLADTDITTDPEEIRKRKERKGLA